MAPKSETFTSEYSEPSTSRDSGRLDIGGTLRVDSNGPTGGGWDETGALT
eukprot:CAMPEP_0118666532 /NCGR_PEP_ID=MMETSP0785-20121206/19267_1 /TAXON_ID=91992 /ORGANISM="Bolidomonas pacifica, Strain CCMP 1866" /LENGTH=49 /DNA_ID=CAMNT_0006560853 /DNA_START=67 /DNA_END=216 /DNA_ORIENTATION=+